MADENFTSDEIDFDDAIIEIANEINVLNIIKKTEPQKSDSQIILKVEMELNKAKASTTNIFQILKTLQEIQIQSDSEQTDTPAISSPIERKYIAHTKGFDHKYHPLTITETVTVHEEISDYQNLTIEDLFEDSETVPQPSVEVSIKKKPQNTDPIIPDCDNQDQLQSGNEKSGKTSIKKVDIPDTITKNIAQQLKDNEKALFRNLMKMQRR